jgi:hypothetical protein
MARAEAVEKAAARAARPEEGRRIGRGRGWRLYAARGRAFAAAGRRRVSGATAEARARALGFPAMGQGLAGSQRGHGRARRPTTG